MIRFYTVIGMGKVPFLDVAPAYRRASVRSYDTPGKARNMRTRLGNQAKRSGHAGEVEYKILRTTIHEDGTTHESEWIQ